MAWLVRLLARLADHRYDVDRRRHIRECQRRERAFVSRGLRGQR